jgi:hypothetical protein
MATAPQSNEFEIVRQIPLKPPPDEALVIAPPPSLGLQRAPQIILEEAAKAAQALRDVIERKPQKVVINGKTFLQFEDWQTLGRFYGITAAARSTTYIEFGRVQGFECHAEAILVSTGQVISAAQAMCLDDESKWSNKPLFQLRSMAQTRAQAKALRNVLAWVVVMAGYAPTPAEEMDGQKIRSVPNRSTVNPLSSDRVQTLCAKIASAHNIAELRTRYLDAGREAQQTNDRNALDAFIQAKDCRKKELQ